MAHGYFSVFFRLYVYPLSELFAVDNICISRLRLIFPALSAKSTLLQCYGSVTEWLDSRMSFLVEVRTATSSLILQYAHTDANCAMQSTRTHQPRNSILLSNPSLIFHCKYGPSWLLTR